MFKKILIVCVLASVSLYAEGDSGEDTSLAREAVLEAAECVGITGTCVRPEATAGTEAAEDGGGYWSAAGEWISGKAAEAASYVGESARGAASYVGESARGAASGAASYVASTKPGELAQSGFEAVKEHPYLAAAGAVTAGVMSASAYKAWKVRSINMSLDDPKKTWSILLVDYPTAQDITNYGNEAKRNIIDSVLPFKTEYGYPPTYSRYMISFFESIDQDLLILNGYLQELEGIGFLGRTRAVLTKYSVQALSYKTINRALDKIKLRLERLRAIRGIVVSSLTFRQQMYKEMRGQEEGLRRVRREEAGPAVAEEEAED